MAEGATVSGVDPSKSLIDIAPATAAVGSVEVLEAVPAASLDLLVVLNVLGYVPHDEQARFWAAARRAVKLGGYMLQANANPKAAAGREYTFMANPDTFPAFLAQNGFHEVGRNFHRFRLGGLGKRIGLPWLIDRHVQAAIPEALRVIRSTGYFSISRRTE